MLIHDKYWCIYDTNNGALMVLTNDIFATEYIKDICENYHYVYEGLEFDVKGSIHKLYFRKA